MTFKYFDKPEVFIGLRNHETTCNLCNETKFCFDAEGYGEDEIDSICPTCLASGQLYNKDISTCSGDFRELKRQLQQIYPAMTETELEALVSEKTLELEKTTPHLITWQDWFWPCSDGDYCKFIGYGSHPFYKDLAGETPVEDFFNDTFYYTYKDGSDIDYLWKEVLPKSQVKDYNDSNRYDTLFYVFQSLNSDKIITIWDCN